MSHGAAARGPRAVVVGGGIGGLAAAIGLRRIGWEPVVLERSPTLGGIGAGVSLWSNALEALDALGVGAAVRGAGTLQSGGGLRRPDGRWLTAGSEAALLERVGVELLLLHREQLHRRLLAALPPGVVRAGAVVTEVEQTADQVLVRHHDSAGADDTRAELLVGADGLHSTVRRELWPEAPVPAYAGFTAWRGVTDEPITIEGEAAETWGHGAEFGAVPLADGRVYWFGTANLPEATTFEDEHAEVLRRFGDWHHPIPAVVQATSPSAVLHHDIYQIPRPLPAFANGRTALLGDAAHAMTPNLGQGACVALEDAAQLASDLAARREVPQALSDYDLRRRPRAENMVTMSAQMGWLIQLEGRGVVALRNLLVRLTPSRAAAARVGRIVDWTAPTIAR